MNRFTFFLFCCLLSGCALLGNRRVNSTKMVQTEKSGLAMDLARVHHAAVSGYRLSNLENAEYNNYKYKFWPGGEARFYADGSVTGIFDSVQLHGKSAEIHRSSNSGQVLFVASDSSKVKSNVTREKVLSKKGKVTERSGDFIMHVAIIVAAILLTGCVLRYLIGQKSGFALWLRTRLKIIFPQ